MFNLSDTIPDAPNFTWREAFVNCTDAEIEAAPKQVWLNLQAIFGVIQRVRNQFNRAITVTSAYRSLAKNKEVGGAPGSYHMQGLAVDFTVAGYEGKEGNLKVQRALDPLPYTQRCGLEYTGGNWTHLDKRGYKARFSPRKK